MPSASLIRVKFKGDGNLQGKLTNNFAGTFTVPRTFTGTYEVTADLDLGLIEGKMTLFFDPDDLSRIGQISILQFVLRSHEEMVFILEAAEVPPNATARLKTAGSAIVSGTLKRAVAPELVVS